MRESMEVLFMNQFKCLNYKPIKQIKKMKSTPKQKRDDARFEMKVLALSTIGIAILIIILLIFK